MRARKPRKNGVAKPAAKKPAAALAALYKKYRRGLSAADLERYACMEGGVPARQVLAELEATFRELDNSPKKGG